MSPIVTVSGCRDCKRCTNAGVSNAGRDLGRGTAALTTMGVSEIARAFTRNCRACGHKLSLHGHTNIPVIVQQVPTAATEPAMRSGEWHGRSTPHPPPPSSPTTPGWYTDPVNGTRLRYHDGSTWTDHTAPFPAAPTPQAAQPPTAPPAAPAPPNTAPTSPPPAPTPPPAQVTAAPTAPVAAVPSPPMAAGPAPASTPPSMPPRLPSLDTTGTRTPRGADAGRAWVVDLGFLILGLVGLAMSGLLALEPLADGDLSGQSLGLGWLLFGVLALIPARIAWKKGHDPFRWWVAGTFLCLPAIVGLRSQEQRSTDRTGWWASLATARRAVIVAMAVLVVFPAIANLGDTGDPEPSTDVTAIASDAETTTTTTAAAPVAEVTETTSVAAPVVTAPPTTAPPPVAAVMPDVPCGTRLDQAYTQLARVGITDFGTEDATGEYRMVLDTANWRVLRQDPKPGEPVLNGGGGFLVVKNDEFFDQGYADQYGC